MIYFISDKIDIPKTARRAPFSEEAWLRARIERDTRRLAVLGSRSGRKYERHIATAVLDKKRFSGYSYAAFLFNTARTTRGFELWEDICSFFRRFRLLSMILRLLAVIMAAIEAGAAFAAFMIAAGVLLALSPAALLWLFAAEVDAAISSAADLDAVRRAAQNGGVTFVFPPRDPQALGRDGTLTRHAGSLAAGGTVLIVSPYMISSRGAGGRGGYSSMRRERAGVYMIRRRFYFKLRRRMGKLFTARDTVMIYL